MILKGKEWVIRENPIQKEGEPDGCGLDLCTISERIGCGQVLYNIMNAYSLTLDQMKELVSGLQKVMEDVERGGK